MTKFLSALTLVVLSPFSIAQKISWADDIACLIYSHCTPCHNTEANSNIPFTNYLEVFNQRLAVELFVNTGKMPPAIHDGNYSQLSGDRHLNQKEVELIKEWARGLAPEGNPNNAPAAPTYGKAVGIILNPDVSFKITYQLPDTIDDHLRRCFVLPQRLSSDKRIKAIEVIPGNMSLVHAVNVYSDTSTIPLQLDLADTKSGYTNFFGTGSNSWKPIYGWTLDSKPFIFPTDLNLKVDSSSYIIVQIQYSEEGVGLLDTSKVNISFASNLERSIETTALLKHDKNLVNGPFTIPVDSTIIFHELQNINSDITLFSISPNAHGYCDNINVYAVRTGNDTVGLLKIDDWNAVWSEGPYYFNKAIHLPAGSVLHAYATYSNTVLNQHDPDDPLEIVNAGIDDDSEEMTFYFSHAPYQVGDENIRFDSLVHYNHYLNCIVTNHPSNISQFKKVAFDFFPNPANEIVIIKSLGSSAEMNIEIFNNVGILCLTKQIGTGNDPFVNVSELKSGLYFMRICNREYSEVQKMFIERN